MIKHFNEEETEYILSKCKEFNDEYLSFDKIKEEKELYIQLHQETNDDQGLRVSFDVYTKELLELIYDFSNNDRSFPLFSLRFDSHVLLSSQMALVKREVAQVVQLEDGETAIVNRPITEGIPVTSLYENIIKNKGNDAWLIASLCNLDDSNCTFKGELISECGRTEATEIGLNIHRYIGNADQQSINGIVTNLKGSVPPLSKDVTSNGNGNNAAVSYDVYAYRVGNANTTLIGNDITDESLLVDCGIEKKTCFRKKYANAENTITTFDPEYILISHNHLDHYNLFFKNIAVQSLALHAKNSSSLKRIIVPDDNSNNLSQNIIKKQIKSKIWLVNKTTPNYRDILKDVFPELTIDFGICPNQAMSVEGKPENFKNDTGIIVSIKNNKKILLPGDCSYDYIPTTVSFDDADYIVIPHHGGKVMRNNIVSMKSNCECIVSSGFNQLYGPTYKDYNANYDQGIFLLACGISNLKNQLKFIVNETEYYSITGI